MLLLLTIMLCCIALKIQLYAQYYAQEQELLIVRVLCYSYTILQENSLHVTILYNDRCQSIPLGSILQ